jgi:peptidoglycan/xylan/chitin deacetylase (PgdA/CDA1 family)
MEVGGIRVFGAVRKKEVLARLLRACGGLSLATSTRQRATNELLVLAYHRVLPTVPESEYPFDIELVSADPEQFDWQMAWISRHFTPLSVSEIVDCLDRKKPLPTGAVAVTFDDGFVDNYTHAFPVLRTRKIPACIFLSTDYVGSDRPYWFEAVARLLMEAPVRSVKLPTIEQLLPRADEHAIRREDIRSVLSELKRMPDEVRCSSLDSLGQQIHSPADSRAGAGAHAVTWSQVREMSRAGMEFGSHGASHAVLSRLNATDLARELADSKLTIERATGATVTAIAYPVGGEDSIGDRVVAAARDAGYRVGFTYQCGTNSADPPDRMRLARQHVERYTGRAYFQGLLALPSVFD